MHPFERKIENTILREKLISVGNRVTVAVSGGADSMALLHVLATLRETIGFSIVAVYADHGLRPGETYGERKLVHEQTCSLGDIRFHWSAIEVSRHAKEHGLSLEHSGRILRYRLLESVASQEKSAKIAVAHQADDQAEEILIRLIRGSGRKGLAGMPFLSGKHVIRPFLEVEKKEILAYLSAKNIPYHEDSTNRQRIHLRNRVRLDLLPYLASRFNPNIGETLRRAASILADEENYLNNIAQETYPRILMENSEGEGDNLTGKRLILGRKPLLAAPRAIQRRLLEMIFWEMDSRPTVISVDTILKLAGRIERRRTLHFARGLRVILESDRIIFTYPIGKTRNRGNLSMEGESVFSIPIPGPGRYKIPPLDIEILFEIPTKKPDQKDFGVPGIEFVDGDTASFPFLVRSPKPGDRFHPLGAPGKKNVSDFLSEQKIPVLERERIPLFVKEGRIVALLGLRIDHAFRITQQTSRTLRITLIRQ